MAQYWGAQPPLFMILTREPLHRTALAGQLTRGGIGGLYGLEIIDYRNEGRLSPCIFVNDQTCPDDIMETGLADSIEP